MNTQITEDYCDFETAKLLKEKGFNEPCIATYNLVTKDFEIEEVYQDWTNQWPAYMSAPTLQMAMKWLREVHHLTIDIFHFRDWKVNIKTIPDDYIKADYSYPELKSAETYEESCEAAIKYCLINLI